MKNFLTVKMSRYILLFVVAMGLPVWLNAQNVRQLPAESLKSRIERIASNSRKNIVYDDKSFGSIQVAALNAENNDLNALLTKSLASTGFTFKTMPDNSIVIKKQEKTAVLSSQQKSTGKGTLQGTVLDEVGNVVTGVMVSIPGTTTGTMTDINGKYMLSGIPEGSTSLQFAFMGYETLLMNDVKISAGRSTLMDVVLKETTTLLNEVVVVGYGTQQKRDITGSVTTIQGSKLRDIPASSVTAALAGMVPGVQVSQTTGAPGAAPSIKIRGTGSITAGNDPLYVIDGFPYENDALLYFNTNDIESVSILKDASATSIYGSRGANGVIIVTTKKGQAGAPKISLDTYLGIQNVTKKVDVLSPEEFVEFALDAVNNSWEYLGNSASDPMESRPPFYQVPAYYLNPDSWVRTDWQDEIFRTALVQNYSLSISGGTESLRYKVSANYYDKDGTIKKSNLKRYTVGTNIAMDLTGKWKLSVGLNAAKTKNTIVNDEGQWGGGIIGTAIGLPGFFGAVNEDGSYPSFEGMGYSVSAVPNPMIFINENDDHSDVARIMGNVAVEYNIIEGLNFKSLFGFDNYNYDYSSFHKGYNGDVPSLDDYQRYTYDPEGSHSSVKSFNWLSENTLNYNVRLNQDHYVGVLLGITAQKYNAKNVSISANNFPDNMVPTLNAGQIKSGSTSESEWSLASYLARINYGFKDRYFASLSMRRDGSSRFGKDNRWGSFPAASAGWLVSEESFMKDINFINYLKIKASYGVTGNNVIPDYGSIGLLSYSYYPVGNSTSMGLVPTTMSNDDLGWETSKQVNAGIELGFFKSRIQLSAEVYQSINDNLLLNVPVPSILGVTTALHNIGKVRNRGMELNLITRNITGDFNWTTDFNISFNRNIVLALGPEGDPIRSTSNQESHITMVGEPIGNFYGYAFEGVYNTMEEINARPHLSTDRPGDPIVKDVNDDGEITVDDRTILGNYQPDFMYGIQNTFSYKGFDLGVSLQGVAGAEIMNLAMRQTLSMNGRTNQLGIARERWRSPEEPGNGKLYSANIDIRGVRRDPSSAYIEDGSYLRVKNITLGYTFNTSFLKNIQISNARIYASAQNPFTFTKYSGYNPEVSTYHSPVTPGVDYLNYPLDKSLVLGLNITF